MTAIVVIVAVGLSAVNERELRRRGERMTALHAASVAFAGRGHRRGARRDRLERRARAAAGLGGPRATRRTPRTRERTWRDGDRALVEMPVVASTPGADDGRPLGAITAYRAVPRLGPPRVRAQQLMALQTLAGGLAAALLQNELLAPAGAAVDGRRPHRAWATGAPSTRRSTWSSSVRCAPASSVGLVMIDVDHFKRYNDQHGHQAGDDALVTVGHVLARAARAEDRACRIGGEEFALLLPGADERAATIVAERVRRDVEGRSPAAGPITISLGVAASRGDDGRALLALADGASTRPRTPGATASSGATASTL